MLGYTKQMRAAYDATVPAFALDRFVENVTVLAPSDGEARHAWLPDGRTTLVFRVLEGGRRGDLAVAGPRTQAFIKNVHGLTRATAIRIKPGWSGPLLGVAAHELTNHIIGIEALWGKTASELDAELLTTRDLREFLDCMSRAFGRRMQRGFESSSARLARHAARLLEGGETRVDRVAERLGVTSRHLRRAFTESVGVAPKEYARAARLQRALRAMASSNDWGRIAAEAGYYDQAHFIGDFRDLVGLTPGAFARTMYAEDAEGLAPRPSGASVPRGDHCA